MARKQRVPEILRRQVRDRADGRCEYCLVHEDDMVYSFEADHIIAEKHAGKTTSENLAWACIICNRNKGPDISSIDQLNDTIVPLFNPRKHHWKRHFRLNGPRIEPLTASARATEFLLQFNTEDRLNQRMALISEGRYLRS
jgi:hypothetical protein